MAKKHIIFGFFVGIASSILGTLIYAIISGMIKGIAFQEIISQAFQNNIVNKLFSLGAILNLIVFFLFIRKRQDNKAKGVLMATLLITFISIVNKLF